MKRIIKILSIIAIVVALLLGGGTVLPVAATWAGGSVRVAAEAPEATTPPPAVNPSPEPTAPSEAASPAEPINWPVLWKVIAGVVVVGLIILLLARRRAY